MRHSILVVDDNSNVTSPIEEYLQRGGFEVSVARSSAEAKIALAEKRFSLVITDLRMETGTDADGLDLIRYIREAKPGLPVFILTASGSPDTATEVIRLQVTKFLGKPLSMPVLLCTVRQFVDEFYGPVYPYSPS